MGIVPYDGEDRLKDRVGECWYLPLGDGLNGTETPWYGDQFLVITASAPNKNFTIHTLVATHSDGKFEFRTMREWSMSPLENMMCKRVG